MGSSLFATAIQGAFSSSGRSGIASAGVGDTNVNFGTTSTGVSAWALLGGLALAGAGFLIYKKVSK